MFFFVPSESLTLVVLASYKATMVVGKRDSRKGSGVPAVKVCIYSRIDKHQLLQSDRYNVSRIPTNGGGEDAVLFEQKGLKRQPQHAHEILPRYHWVYVFI